jgi:hypothetical protein
MRSLRKRQGPCITAKRLVIVVHQITFEGQIRFLTYRMKLNGINHHLRANLTQEKAVEANACRSNGPRLYAPKAKGVHWPDFRNSLACSTPLRILQFVKESLVVSKLDPKDLQRHKPEQTFSPVYACLQKPPLALCVRDFKLQEMADFKV